MMRSTRSSFLARSVVLGFDVPKVERTKRLFPLKLEGAKSSFRSYSRSMLAGAGEAISSLQPQVNNTSIPLGGFFHHATWHHPPRPSRTAIPIDFSATPIQRMAQYLIKYKVWQCVTSRTWGKRRMSAVVCWSFRNQIPRNANQIVTSRIVGFRRA